MTLALVSLLGPTEARFADSRSEEPLDGFLEKEGESFSEEEIFDLEFLVLPQRAEAIIIITEP